MEDLVFLTKKGTPATDSLRIAAGFGKSHKNVLRALENLDCDPEFSRLNFGPSTYLDSRGKKQRSVVMTKDGFAFLVMGFTGKRAAAFKQGYIEQFNRMEADVCARRVAEAPRALPEFTSAEVQVQCVKQAASQLLRPNNDPQDIIAHHRGVMRSLTGKTPSEYVRSAVAAGLRVASLSGRQLLRRLDPAKAATAAFMDDQLRHGRTLEQLTQAGIAEALPHAFAALLRAGFSHREIGLP
jgi:Rha family phage regulatory protein